MAGPNCSIARHQPQGSLCSVPACVACGRLLPSLMVIGSIKSGTSALWGQLVDLTEGAVVSGGVTHKGEISRKEKDFFGDPSQWRHGRAWYERVWPRCPPAGQLTIGVDATPAYHVWHDAPANMAAFFGPSAAPRLRLVWLLRDPVAKAWSYFWELKSYGGDWDAVAFGPWVSCLCFISSHNLLQGSGTSDQRQRAKT